jgi:hypothetical protein
VWPSFAGGALDHLWRIDLHDEIPKWTPDRSSMPWKTCRGRLIKVKATPPAVMVLMKWSYQ